MANKNVKLSFPEDAYAGMVDSFADAYKYQETITVNGESVPNPESKEQHFHRKVIEFVATIWKPYAKRLALAAQEQHVASAVEARATEVMAATSVNVEEVP